MVMMMMMTTMVMVVVVVEMMIVQSLRNHLVQNGKDVRQFKHDESVSGGTLKSNVFKIKLKSN